jgi:hypothetical protein
MGTAQDMLDMIGIDQLCERIEAGDDLRVLTQWAGVSLGALHNYLRATPERDERYTRALELSAEELLTKGRAIIESSLRRDSGIDPSAAKALDAAYARLAAIRNKAYSDKPTTAIQINNAPQALTLPVNADPIAASRAYAALIEQ